MQLVCQLLLCALCCMGRVLSQSTQPSCRMLQGRRGWQLACSPLEKPHVRFLSESEFIMMASWLSLDQALIWQMLLCTCSSLHKTWLASLTSLDCVQAQTCNRLDSRLPSYCFASGMRAGTEHALTLLALGGAACEVPVTGYICLTGPACSQKCSNLTEPIHR